MRNYKIKRGYDPDINAIIKDYFGVNADVEKGCKFEVEGIGKIDMRQDKKLLIVDIEPPKKVTGDYGIIKKWNNFLFDATGKTTKERKKDFGKIKKK